jgi:hypothetical protein
LGLPWLRGGLASRCDARRLLADCLGIALATLGCITLDALLLVLLFTRLSAAPLSLPLSTAGHREVKRKLKSFEF